MTPLPTACASIRLAGADVHFPLALGCTGMSGMYGPADERESIAQAFKLLEK